MVSAIHHHLPGASVRVPQGGYFLWVELPVHIDADEVVHRAAKAGVAIFSGKNSFAEAGPSNFLRLAYSYCTPGRIVEGIELVGAWLSCVARRERCDGEGRLTMAQMIDLSSDTATQPSADRIAFVMSCSLGSDQKGGEDPTVNRLQKRGARASWERRRRSYCQTPEGPPAPATPPAVQRQRHRTTGNRTTTAHLIATMLQQQESC